MSKVIRMDEVKVGDRVYDEQYFARDKFREVTFTCISDHTVTLKLGVTAHATIDTRTNMVGHPEEGILVWTERVYHE